MYKGVPTEGLDFYNLLLNNNEFCSELGKVTLAAGRLEVELIQFLTRENINENYARATLGRLINIATINDLLNENLIIGLKLVCRQRNYLTHNIYALLSDNIEETVLERENLFDSDVRTYIERALQLKTNLVHLANVINKK